ncbi:type 1 glutamine amidotransferase domain-containing protein [Microbulbifer sp. Q7]|uniref:type 1 glutamine amidotransferase domain-containing protein n=1 Tax=Microbulbifer sp. Q7 TaxID=1785091 RepID=UPI0009EF299F|nr:type 1 glutamine amidotransferase domain-containing protein [Microbulbifer sp. Q7]
MKKLVSLFIALCLATTASLALAAPRVLIVATSHEQMGDTDEKTGLWLSELTHPYHELKKAGFEVEIASIKGGAVPVDARSLADDDAVNFEFLASPQTRSLLDNTRKLADVSPKRYQAILFAGGHGTVWDFPKSPAVNSVASAIYADGGYVAALCHGPAALLNVTGPDGKPIIAGKKVAGFSNVEEKAVGLADVVPYLLQDELTALGANYQEGKAWESFVVQDGRIITGQNPQSAAELGQVLAKALKK